MRKKKNWGRMGRNGNIALIYKAPGLAKMLAENRQKKGRRAGIGESTMFGKHLQLDSEYADVRPEDTVLFPLLYRIDLDLNFTLFVSVPF